MKPTEDQIVRFYACKTIENITALSISTGYKFSTLDVTTLLINAFHITTIEAFNSRYTILEVVSTIEDEYKRRASYIKTLELAHKGASLEEIVKSTITD